MKTSFSMAWRPAESPISQRNRMGQVIPAPTPLIESAELQASIDFTATAASGFLAYAMYKTNNSTWGLVWSLVSVGAGMKFLHDLSKF